MSEDLLREFQTSKSEAELDCAVSEQDLLVSTATSEAADTEVESDAANDDDETEDDLSEYCSVIVTATVADLRRLNRLRDRAYCVWATDELQIEVMREGLAAVENPSHPIWIGVNEQEQRFRAAIDKVLARPQAELQALVASLQVVLGSRSVGGTDPVDMYAFDRPRGAGQEMKKLATALPFVELHIGGRRTRIGVRRGQHRVARAWLARALARLEAAEVDDAT